MKGTKFSEENIVHNPGQSRYLSHKPHIGKMASDFAPTIFTILLHISDLATSEQHLEFLSSVRNAVTFIILPLPCIYVHVMYQNGTLYEVVGYCIVTMT